MRWVLGIIAAIVLAVYGYYEFHVWSRTFHFRMTMTVSTPEADKSASSVIAVYLPTELGGSPGQGISRGTIKGTAPFVNLGQYGSLIAALHKARNGPTGRVPTEIVRSRQPRMAGTSAEWIIVAAYDLNPDAIKVSAISQRGAVSLKENELPQLVWIPPPATSPALARPLHPTEFSSYIGAGVRLESIVIEPTHDRVIERVTDPPEWLRTLRRDDHPSNPKSWQSPSGRFKLKLKAVESEY